MKAVRMLKTEKGFSLIELMIVVAIIGILATVAIPNFSRFQAKARASESRAQLAALFTAQKAFHAEYNTYHSDLWTIGYRPNGTLRYLVGIGASHTAGFPGTAPTGLTANRFSTSVICTATAPMNQCVNGAVTSTGTAITALTTAGSSALNTFSARAEGFIGGTQNDIWTINENKTVANPQQGGF
jgi:type IV pilus assembly protein PilA